MGLGTHPSARLTAAQLAAVAALISDCARPTAKTALLTAMAALLSRRCAESPRCCPALDLRYAPNGETPNPREEQINSLLDSLLTSLLASLLALGKAPASGAATAASQPPPLG